MGHFRLYYAILAITIALVGQTTGDFISLSQFLADDSPAATNSYTPSTADGNSLWSCGFPSAPPLKPIETFLSETSAYYAFNTPFHQFLQVKSGSSPSSDPFGGETPDTVSFFDAGKKFSTVLATSLFDFFDFPGGGKGKHGLSSEGSSFVVVDDISTFEVIDLCSTQHPTIAEVQSVTSFSAAAKSFSSSSWTLLLTTVLATAIFSIL